MPAIATNNAKSTLSSALSNTSMTVSVADGSSFPTPSTGEYFYVTLVDSSNNTEIVKCTVRAGNGMTILRGQDGTTARTFSASDRIELRVVAAYLNEGNEPSGISTGKAIAMAIVFG